MGGSEGSRIGRWLNRLLILAVCAISLLVLQKSLHFTPRGPHFNVDDSIGNVAVSLAEYGRYGFLSSPTQGLHEVDRTHAFFNYGPLWFYAASFFVWLFGPSLTLFRMLHPLGLVAIVAICAVTFRRISIVGAAAFACAIYKIYLGSHWPFGRPDIMVSVCVVAFLYFAERGVRLGRALDWATAGFCAASAATTHLIAIGMVPAAAVVCLWSLASPSADVPGVGFVKRALPRIAALTVGGVLGALVFLWSMRFRIGDLLVLGGAGVDAHVKSYWQAVHDHWEFAWGGVTPFRFVVLIAGFAVAFGVCALARKLPGRAGVDALSLTMPALVSSAVYQLVVGFYGNNHSGYVIVSQVTTFWAASSLFPVGISIVEGLSERWRPYLDHATKVCAILVVAATTLAWSRHPDLWEASTIGDVSLEEYNRQVTAPLPERASTWGSLYFGVDAGDRTDLVQFLQMFSVASQDFRPEERTKIAPDFLLLSNYELDASTVLTLDRQQSLIDTFKLLFPSEPYRVTHLTYAPPYGTTRTYERIPAGSPSGELEAAVSVNDGSGRQWSGLLQPQLDVAFSPTEPVVADLAIYALHPRRRASASVVADLPPGFFLVTAEVPQSSVDEAGEILATSGRYFLWKDGETRFAIPGAPYWGGLTRVQMVVDHLGGPLYVSRYQNEPAGAAAEPADPQVGLYGNLKGEVRRTAEASGQARGIRIVSVRPIRTLQNGADRVDRVAVPPAATWVKKDAGLNSRSEATGLRISGNPTPGALLMETPEVKLADHRRYVLTVPTSPASGSVAIGVLDQNGSWLATPTPMPARIVFDSGMVTGARIVVENVGFAKDVPLDVVIGSATLETAVPKELYVDRLMGRRLFH